MHRFLVSAAHRSSGKTTVSIGLAAALRARGLAVQPFKKGPDYIDPMWLGEAAGRPCYNLDPWVSGPDEIRATFSRRSRAAQVCMVEANMGLHDGLALDGSNSNAALAAMLGLPVVLVIDARGMSRGIAPLLLGQQAFDPTIRIAGVILNRVGGKRHEAKLRAAIEHYTDIPVLGAIPNLPELTIDERHLGLVPYNEAAEAHAHVARLAQAIAVHVDLDRLLALTAAGDELPREARPAATALRPPRARPRVRIGIARDAAFGFYYAEDLEALAAAGADLVPFDTLHDAQLPAVDGLFIGGGFPEAVAPALEANAALREALRREIENGLPVYAECGGLMYLTRSIRWHDRTHAMVGALPADTVMQARAVGRGYVEIEATADHPWLAPGAIVRAHEFHHSSLENVAPDLRYAWHVRRGHGIDGRRDGLIHRNVLGAYCHLRSVLGIEWPAHFVGFVHRCRAARCAAEPALACG